mmetsp:Transcript_104585/g.337252  ORF Transcript_104585/g.337252 Transcript_104585/m.337252 type:complete len:212 (+) Transcript_104585:55-690(+)
MHVSPWPKVSASPSSGLRATAGSQTCWRCCLCCGPTGRCHQDLRQPSSRARAPRPLGVRGPARACPRPGGRRLGPRSLRTAGQLPHGRPCRRAAPERQRRSRSCQLRCCRHCSQRHVGCAHAHAAATAPARRKTGWGSSAASPRPSAARPERPRATPGAPGAGCRASRWKEARKRREPSRRGRARKPAACKGHRGRPRRTRRRARSCCSAA